jgi:hypothetical protein
LGSIELLLSLLSSLSAGLLCALAFGAMLYFARALAFDQPLLLALPFALLAAVGAYFGAMNAAVAHAVLPHTSPLARAEPGTHTALARQIVRCPPGLGHLVSKTLNSEPVALHLPPCSYARLIAAV